MTVSTHAVLSITNPGPNLSFVAKSLVIRLHGPIQETLGTCFARCCPGDHSRKEAVGKTAS